MATPAAAGALLLILQQYRLTREEEPLPSTLKALLLHAARDLGRAGIEADMTAQDEVDTYLLRVAPQTGVLKVTLVWDDVPGALNAARALVNDLDLELVAPDDAIFYPWLLAPGAPAAPAKTGPDHLHTVEQVVVQTPVASSEWLPRVRAFRLHSVISEKQRDLHQRYSLIVEGGNLVTA